MSKNKKLPSIFSIVKAGITTLVNLEGIPSQRELKVIKTELSKDNKGAWLDVTLLDVSDEVEFEIGLMWNEDKNTVSGWFYDEDGLYGEAGEVYQSL